MSWKDFQSFFHDLSICYVGPQDIFPHRIDFQGVYDKDKLYGFQGELTTQQTSQVMITVAKEDLRYAQGSDSNNRQGVYLMEKVDENQYVRVASTGEFARQEVTLEALIHPNKKYVVAGWSKAKKFGFFFFK